MWYYNLIMNLGLLFMWLSLFVVIAVLLWVILGDLRKSYISGDSKGLWIKSASYTGAIMSIVAVIVLKAYGVITWQLPWFKNLSW